MRVGRGVQSRLDTLSRGNCQQRLGHAGAETGQHGARTGHLAVLVGEEFFVLVEGDESWEGVSHGLFFLRYMAQSCDVRMPALAELPMISVVHPAYHCRPNGGHGSFWPSGSRRLSCDLVLATN